MCEAQNISSASFQHQQHILVYLGYWRCHARPLNHMHQRPECPEVTILVDEVCRNNYISLPRNVKQVLAVKCFVSSKMDPDRCFGDSTSRSWTPDVKLCVNGVTCPQTSIHTRVFRAGMQVCGLAWSRHIHVGLNFVLPSHHGALSTSSTSTSLSAAIFFYQ